MCTPGKDNLVANLLSRYPTHSITPQEAEINILDNDGANKPPCLVDFHLIAQHQNNDAALQALLQTDDYFRQLLHNIDIIFYQQGSSLIGLVSI